MRLFLKLFHGRKDPKADMEDWGEEGPVFDLGDQDESFAHTTYASDIKCGYTKAGVPIQFDISSDGLVYYDGWYYGDWSVFVIDDGSVDKIAKLERLMVAFNPALTRPPATEPEGWTVRTLLQALAECKDLDKRVFFDPGGKEPQIIYDIEERPDGVFLDTP